jgi:hypothetical protein
LAPLLTRRQEAQIHALFALEFESNHARRMSVPSMSVSAIDIRRQFTTYFLTLCHSMVSPAFAVF